ncbi:MAG: hypothetical protein R2912_09345 [Eubacteriales bacterium]
MSRFAQFGNSIDDVDGMAADPIKQAIERAVNVTLKYDTGTDGFDVRVQTKALHGRGRAGPLPHLGRDRLSKWVSEDLVYNLSDIVNASQDRYPTLSKVMNSPSTRCTTSSTRAMRTTPTPSTPSRRLRIPSLPVSPFTIRRSSTPSTAARFPRR